MDPVLAPGCRFIPSSATVYCVALELNELWNSYAPTSLVVGFDHTLFDKSSAAAANGGWQPLPLWQHPHNELSVHTVVQKLPLSDLIDFSSPIEVRIIPFHIIASGDMHAVAIWVEYDIGEGRMLGKKPKSGGGPDAEGCAVQWFAAPRKVSAGDIVKTELYFDVAKGDWRLKV